MPIRVTVLHKSAFLTHRDVIIGRGEASDIRIDDASLSRVHASLRIEGGRVRLTDLASSNGTRVNGEPVVGSRIVELSDRIEIGSLTIALQLVTGVPGGTGSRLEDDTLGHPVPDENEVRTFRQPSVAAPPNGRNSNGSGST